MMATEPSTEKPTDVPAPSESRPADQAHHAVLDAPLSVNGNPAAGYEDIANKRITTVEEQLNSADVSVSGGSDTEASRADWARQKDGDKGHGRTSSSAKKASFKPVSVNKTFLASKANSSATVPKTSDKPTTGSNTPPPGSTTTLSASRPRLVAKSGSGTRDATSRLSSTINGGKPAAAPSPSAVWNRNRPPEPKKFTDEELKKYGIHMASRLNEDDTQGQNKWADIDDDDDDWAPATITWGDGTKTTLPHLDEQTAAALDNGDNGSVISKSKALEKPKSPAPPAAAGSPLSKPGSLTSGKGLVLKGASVDKPALVAKPPAPPAPAKSPWATLPPIDRASPASAEAANPPRDPLTESSSLKRANVQPKEIAADDFSRSCWRDGPSQGSRELFNSHSGRYEPVPDRRVSMRSDPQAKRPALLQRPQPSDQPAEPSSAFQTSRISQDAPFGRRRGSSNVSGGSGSYLQRMGKGNDIAMQSPSDFFGARRTSVAGSAESSVSPANVAAPVQAQPRHQGWMPRSSPGGTFAAPYNGPLPPEAKTGLPQPATVIGDDDLEYQKKVMRETRELARKRRQEEEAREEEAKRERIQKKLEAMGPPPEKKSDKNAAAKEGALKPTQIQQREPSEPARASAAAMGQELQTGSDTSASSLRKAQGANPVAISKDGPPSGPAARRLSHGQEGKRVDPWAGPGPRADRFTSWPAGVPAGVPPPSRNVWGSPNNDRGLGNGTFNPDLGRIPSSVVPPPASRKGPSPIAPPTATRVPSQAQAHSQDPIGSQGTRYGAPGSDLASKWVAAVAEKDKKISAARLAERAGRERQLAEQGLTAEDAQPTIKDTWRPIHLPGDGTRRVMGAVEVQSHAPGPWKSPQEKLAKGTAPVGDAVPPPNAGVIGSGSSSILSHAGPGTAASQSRASRFFPTKESRRDVGSAAEPSRPASPSPPPPTMEGHPAYEGDALRPHVSLPKPHPVVKLPPPRMALQPSPPRTNMAWTSRLSFSEAPRGLPSQGDVSHRDGDNRPGNWQDKINNLLNGGKTSPPKHLGVEPASRSVLDHPIHRDLATVSLPSVASVDVPGSQRSPISKPMAEECFEEQEMGSLPQIRLPHRAPEAAWQPAVAQTKPLPKRFLVQASIMEPYLFAADVVGGGNVMKVQLPGMAEAKTVTLPFSVSRGARTGHGRPSPRHRTLGHGPRGAKRDSSSNFGPRDSGPGNPGRGVRGGFRRRGSDSWSRQTPSGPIACAAKGTAVAVNLSNNVDRNSPLPENQNQAL